MALLILPSDDLPPRWTSVDALWQRQFEQAIARYFYQGCSGVTQALLTNYEWTISVASGILTLQIWCADLPAYDRLQHNLAVVGNFLLPFSENAHLCIYLYPEETPTLDIQVSALKLQQDTL